MEGSIRKRGAKSWEITLDLGRDENGKRDRRYFTVRGTKKQAQQRQRELLTELDGGAVPSSERIKMRDWLDRWMLDCIVGHQSEATRERYGGIIKNHLKPSVGHIELRKLSPMQVQSLQQKLLQDGMHPKGVNLVRTVLSGSMNHALSLEMIMRNPVSATKAPPDPDHEVQPAPMEAVLVMLRLAADEEDWVYPALHMLVYTGVRRGELLGLRWDHIDLDSGEVRIEYSLVRRSNKLILTKPKTAKGVRTINLDAGTVEVMRRYRARQERHKAAMAGAYEDNGVVFADELGRWLNPMRLTRVVASLAKKVGHPEAQPHNLRHFHATVSLKREHNIAVVSQRLGHANPAITLKVYSHVMPGWQQELADDFAGTMDESQKALQQDVAGHEKLDDQKE